MVLVDYWYCINAVLVLYLSSPLDPFPDTEVAEYPGNTQGHQQLYFQTTRLINLALQITSILTCFLSEITDWEKIKLVIASAKR